jgi:hypothetical protein
VDVRLQRTSGAEQRNLDADAAAAYRIESARQPDWTLTSYYRPVLRANRQPGEIHGTCTARQSGQPQALVFPPGDRHLPDARTLLAMREIAWPIRSTRCRCTSGSARLDLTDRNLAPAAPCAWRLAAPTTSPSKAFVNVAG